MADERNEEAVSDIIKESKEATALNESSGKQETKCSMLIQNRKISSQFTSPVTKRSSPDSGKIQQSLRTKRAKYNSKDGDGNQSYKEANEKKELESVLRKKEDTLRKLKLVKMYRAKNNLTDLEELIEKWRSICQQAAEDLYGKFNQANTLTMGKFLDGLRVKHDLIRYSEDEEAFY
ncbi:Hypothetical predicted protein [Paramuricea clavata]|nr:Hypothetical predicted protein [Paramuricea clavata]